MENPPSPIDDWDYWDESTTTDDIITDSDDDNPPPHLFNSFVPLPHRQREIDASTFKRAANPEVVRKRAGIAAETARNRERWKKENKQAKRRQKIERKLKNIESVKRIVPRHIPRQTSVHQHVINRQYALPHSHGMNALQRIPSRNIKPVMDEVDPRTVYKHYPKYFTKTPITKLLNRDLEDQRGRGFVSLLQKSQMAIPQDMKNMK
jgi:hypothetical protein